METGIFDRMESALGHPAEYCWLIMFQTFYSYINERNRKRNIVEAEKAAAVSFTLVDREVTAVFINKWFNLEYYDSYNPVFIHALVIVPKLAHYSNFRQQSRGPSSFRKQVHDV